MSNQLDHLGNPLPPFVWNPAQSRATNLFRKYRVRIRAEWEGEFNRYNAHAYINGALQIITTNALPGDVDGEVAEWLERAEAA